MSRRILSGACAAFAVLALISAPALATPRCRTGEPAIAELFTGWWCPDCNDARLFLYRYGIPFLEYQIENQEIREKLFRRSGRGTTPAIFLCGAWVFGYGEEQEQELVNLLSLHNARFSP